MDCESMKFFLSVWYFIKFISLFSFPTSRMSLRDCSSNKGHGVLFLSLFFPFFFWEILTLPFSTVFVTPTGSGDSLGSCHSDSFLRHSFLILFLFWSLSFSLFSSVVVMSFKSQRLTTKEGEYTSLSTSQKQKRKQNLFSLFPFLDRFLSLPCAHLWHSLLLVEIFLLPRHPMSHAEVSCASQTSPTDTLLRPLRVEWSHFFSLTTHLWRHGISSTSSSRHRIRWVFCERKY